MSGLKSHLKSLYSKGTLTQGTYNRLLDELAGHDAVLEKRTRNNTIREIEKRLKKEFEKSESNPAEILEEAKQKMIKEGKNK